MQFSLKERFIYCIDNQFIIFRTFYKLFYILYILHKAFSSEISKIFKNTFFKRTPPVAASHFCLRQKNKRKHNQHFKLLFQMKYTILDIKTNIYSIFGLLFSKKRTYSDENILCLKINHSQMMQIRIVFIVHKLENFRP